LRTQETANSQTKNLQILLASAKEEAKSRRNYTLSLKKRDRELTSLKLIKDKLNRAKI